MHPSISVTDEEGIWMVNKGIWIRRDANSLDLQIAVVVYCGRI